MNNENPQIKALVPSFCPHCKKELVIEFTTQAPSVTAILTPESILEAKVVARTLIASKKIPEDVRKMAMEVIDRPETIFSPSDVTSIVESLTAQEEKNDLP